MNKAKKINVLVQSHSNPAALIDFIAIFEKGNT